MSAIKDCRNCGRVFKEEKDFFNNTSQWRLCSAENLWFNCKCGSTLMLPKGKFPWYSPTSGMSDEASLLFNKISQNQELPHIPTAILEIQQMLADSGVETTALAQAVKRDPLLAAEIIHVAENLRSFRTSDSSPMKSLEHAIAYIGRKYMSELVIAASIKGFKLPTHKFDVDSFWKHAFLTAAIAEKLADRFNYKNIKDKAYLAGCLCNIGKIICALFFPKDADKIEDYISNIKTQTTWQKAEKQYNIHSHCILGEIGCAFWGLPEFVIDAARYHHHRADEMPTSDFDTITKLAGFANILAHWVMLEPHRIDEAVLNSYKKKFSINNQDLEDLTHELSNLSK